MTVDDLTTRLGARVDLAQKHVLVTGASRGIGAAIADELARSGARVSLVSRRWAQVEAMRLRLPNPETHAAIEADVTDAYAVERMATEAAARLGTVYALVNNAGGGEAVPFLEAEADHWRRMIDVNLMSAVFCTRALLPAMQSQRAGRVVNMGSTASLRGYKDVSAYTAAKHALLGLTRSVAREVDRDGVVVCAVCPGYTETEMLVESIRAASSRTGRSEGAIRERFVAGNTGGRLVHPVEVARVVAWLCSEEAAVMNGKHVVLDGGLPEVFA